MVGATKVNGLPTTWKVWVSTVGKMGVFSMVNIEMIKNMVTVSMNGKTIENTKDTGPMGSSTVLEYTQL
jgi:hypothetical protein